MALFRAASLTLFLAGAYQCKGRRINYNPRRQLRSNTRAMKNDMGSDSFVINHHPNPVTERNSFFSEQKCSPDGNGYYGSTAGTPSEVTFGFGVETTPGADMSEVFVAILESVENALLTTFFPTLCHDGKSSGRIDVEPSRKLDIHGFRFDPESNRYSESCTPEIDATNSCDIYAGTVRVYGEGHHALNVIRDHLDFDGTENIHPKLERIFSVTPSDRGENSENMETVSMPAKDDTSSSFIVGISVAVVTLSIGILVASKRRTRQSQLSEGRSASGTASAGDGRLSPHQDHASSQDLEEASDVVEINLQSGSSLVLRDGQPVYASYVNELV